MSKPQTQTVLITTQQYEPKRTVADYARIVTNIVITIAAIRGK